MLEIKITGETPLEALASLTAFGLHCLADKTVHDAANRILEAEQAKESKEAAKVSKLDTTVPTGAAAAATELSAAAGKTAAPTNTKPPADLPLEPYVEDPPHGEPQPMPEPEPQPAPEPPPAPEDQPKPPALEVIRAKGLAAAQKYGKPAVKAILESFGVPSMTNLAESDRAAFLVKLEALEGQGDGNA